MPINWPDLTFPPVNQPVLMDALSFEEQQKSPCVQVCKVQDGICLGCHRTLDEITHWSVMTEEEKAKVKERIYV